MIMDGYVYQYTMLFTFIISIFINTYIYDGIFNWIIIVNTSLYIKIFGMIVNEENTYSYSLTPWSVYAIKYKDKWHFLYCGIQLSRPFTFVSISPRISIILSGHSLNYFVSNCCPLNLAFNWLVQLIDFFFSVYFCSFIGMRII